MESKFTRIIETLGEGVGIMNFKEDFLFANPAACKIFEVPNEKLVNRNLKEFVEDKEWDKILNQTKRRKTGESGKYQLEIITKKKNKRIILITATPEYNQSGEAINTVSIFYDITESVKEKDKLKELNQQFEELHQQLFTQTLEADIQKKEVEKYSKQLNAGINYAKTIQDSLLPTMSQMNKKLSDDLFVIYKPKQTIGGDFYYMKERDNYIIFAVADCTGHGVSGALISMLGITFINDIIDRNLLVNSSEILDKLRQKVKYAFKIYGNDIQNKNGMDISLCIVNKKTNMMQFSGAYNPLFIIRSNELAEYKATKNPIGYYPVEKNFESHQIQLLKNDNIYLFSDGYTDQMGGEADRKFSKKRFRELLLSIHQLNSTEQKKTLEKEFINWKGRHEQVDDMTVLGLKWQIY